VVIGAAATGAEAFALIARQAPAVMIDIVVMDWELPGGDGGTVMAALRTTYSACRILILSLHDDPQTRAQVQAAGATHFVSKHESPAVLIAAIRQACARDGL
jgi:DNA-binding NarL/FixJ family response regulator